MKQILETKRLILREWQPGEEALLATFLGDDRVMHAYEGGFNEAEIAKWLQWNLASYAKRGFGLWGIQRKSDGKLIGECGLTMQEVEGERFPEIGYHLIYDAWHQGYMTEAAQAVKHYAFETLGLSEVASIVRDTNLASMNVAIRNGMTARKRFVKVYRGVTMPHYLFAVSSAETNQSNQ